MSAPRTPPTRRNRGFRDSPGPTAVSGPLSLPPERARALLFVAFRPAAFALAVIVAVVLASLLSAGSDLTGLSGAVAAGWLAVHQVPLTIGSVTLGILPVLPTGLLLWAAARETTAAIGPEPTRPELGWLFGAAVGGPLVITAVCLAVTEDASGTIALQRPDPLVAFAWVLLLHTAAAACGVAVRCRDTILEWLPYDVISAAYVAGRSVLRLVGASAALTVLSLLLHWSTVGETYSAADNFVDVIGLTLLSLLYLPNLAVAAIGVLVGPGMQFGDAAVGVFAVVGGPIPGVPLLAAVPTAPVAIWWAVLLLVPAAIGVYAGVESARVSYDRVSAPWSVLGAAGLASVGLTVAAALAGGELGNFGRLGVELPVFALAVFAWLALPGFAGLMYARTFLISFPTPLLRHPDTRFDLDDFDDPEDDRYGYGDYDDYPDDLAEDAAAPGPEPLPAADPPVELDAELVDDEPVVTTVSAAVRYRSADTGADAEIVDAEVVDPDLPEGGSGSGR